jgi:hypothetical protein
MFVIVATTAGLNRYAFWKVETNYTKTEIIKIWKINTSFKLDLVGTRKILSNKGFHVVKYFTIFPFNKINHFLWQALLFSACMEVVDLE